MGGMTRSLSSNNPTILSAFHAALFDQLLIVIGVVVVAAVAWYLLQNAQYRRAVAAGRPPIPVGARSTAEPEPLARHILRIAFGLIWVFDGLLQAQTGMVLGMPNTVLRPAATGSPGWVVHLVNWGATIWTDHPVPAAASAVWIQLGVGFLLLVAPRGWWSRSAGMVSVGWALVVWAFGEAFGSIFAPGLTWAFGAPGAVVFYAVAGVLVALPERLVAGPRLGRLVTAGMGVFFLGMAVLQAWPGRGFWQGHIGKTPGPLTAMVSSMAQTPTAGVPVGLGVVLRRLRRGPRLGGEPVLGGGPGRHRGGPVHRADPVSSSSPPPPAWCCAWPTGCWSRTWGSSAGWAPIPTPWSPCS